MTLSEQLAELERQVAEMKQQLHDLANHFNRHVLLQAREKYERERKKEKERAGQSES